MIDTCVFKVVESGPKNIEIVTLKQGGFPTKMDQADLDALCADIEKQKAKKWKWYDITSYPFCYVSPGVFV